MGERGVLGARARARAREGAGRMWRKTKGKMRWVDVRGEQRMGGEQVAGWGWGTEQYRENRGRGERGRGTLRWRQREAQGEDAGDEEKQGAREMPQMCGQAEGTKGRPCFSGPLALGRQLEGIPGPAQQTDGRRVEEAVARPAWPASRVLRDLGRMLSSFLHLSKGLLSLRGGGRTQEIQRKQLWLVQRRPREVLDADRRPGMGASL